MALTQHHHNFNTFLRTDTPLQDWLPESAETQQGTHLLLDQPTWQSAQESILFNPNEETTNPIITDIQNMCGIQSLDMEKRLLFYLHTKQVEVEPFNNGFTEELQHTMMALTIDKCEADVWHKPATLAHWRQVIGKMLLGEATVDLMTEDEMYGAKEILEKHKPQSFTEMKNLYYSSIKFMLQRQRSKIAKITRRGLGNTLVGTRAAIEKILENTPDLGKRGLNVVIFEDGEITDKDKPFVLIGYKGASAYDSSLLFGYRGTDKYGWGGFGGYENIKKYWRRIV
jgi:hypothetical protein